jgi:hypothetical protein
MRGFSIKVLLLTLVAAVALPVHAAPASTRAANAESKKKVVTCVIRARRVSIANDSSRWKAAVPQSWAASAVVVIRRLHSHPRWRVFLQYSPRVIWPA